MEIFVESEWIPAELACSSYSEDSQQAEKSSGLRTLPLSLVYKNELVSTIGG
jgi:hypothetical protein